MIADRGQTVSDRVERNARLHPVFGQALWAKRDLLAPQMLSDGCSVNSVHVREALDRRPALIVFDQLSNLLVRKTSGSLSNCMRYGPS
jgi:hypothetical protein